MHQKYEVFEWTGKTIFSFCRKRKFSSTSAISLKNFIFLVDIFSVSLRWPFSCPAYSFICLCIFFPLIFSEKGKLLKIYADHKWQYTFMLMLWEPNRNIQTCDWDVCNVFWNQVFFCHLVVSRMWKREVFFMQGHTVKQGGWPEVVTRKAFCAFQQVHGQSGMTVLDWWTSY